MSFAPVYDDRSRALILGTWPSPKSREMAFYYGHPQNRFWPLLAALTGEPLPVRELAADAGVNPNTMQRALQELESRGLLQAQRTAGRTVTADDTALLALRRRRAGTLAAEFLHQMQALGLTEAEIETLLRETAQQAPKKE